MEQLIEEIKDNACLDFNSTEIQDISEATEILLERLIKSIVEVNPLFAVKKLVACGSMAEKTRNWKFTGKQGELVIEFDFLAILKNPPQEEISLTRQCDGFVQIIDKNEHLKHFCNKFQGDDPQKSLLGDRVAFSFLMDLLKSVNFLCTCFNFDMNMQSFNKDECCKYVVQGTIQQKGTGCNKCTVCKKSGFLQMATGNDVGSPFYNSCTVVFKWTSTSCTLKVPDLVNFDGNYCASELYVLVDFLPSFEVLKHDSSESKNDSHDRSCGKREMLAPDHDYYLVPKRCTRDHHSCWKVSHCATEINVIRTASQVHRFTYMILKFITDRLFSGYVDDGSIPSTYRIKTAVLHHIKHCSNAPKPPNLLDCVRQLLNDISYSFFHQLLPNFVNGLNLLSVKMLYSNTKQCILHVQNETWHKNRCIIVGECLSFVHELFKNSWSLGVGLQCGVRMLKYIGSAYHNAWSITEYQCNYGVNRDKLLYVVEKELAKDKEFIHVDFKGQLVRQDFDQVHWTKNIPVWEYDNVRKLYARYHLECPDPPGREPGREETIYLEARSFSGYHEWERKDQVEWIRKLENSGSPNDIVAALKSVDIYYFDDKAEK